MREHVIEAVVQYCEMLCKSNMATKEEVGEIITKITAVNDAPKRKELLNKKQVAELAKVHPRTVDRWVEDGKLNKRIIGNNSCRFDSEDVSKFLFG